MSIIHKTIYTCEEATKLVVKKREQKLSTIQRFKLWLHLAICSACKRFEIQNTWLDNQLHKIASIEPESKLPIHSKEKIAAALRAETGKDTP